MDPDLTGEAVEQAQRACLKQSFGGQLDALELEQLRRYLETAAGQQYQSDARKIQHQLHDIAEVRIPEPLDSNAMVAKFESMAREQLQESRRWLPLFVLLTVGGSLLIGTWSLLSGKPNLSFFGWMMLVWAVLFTALFTAIARKTNAWIRDQDLLLRIEEEQRLGNSTPVIVTGSIIAFVTLCILTIALWKAGGALSISIAWAGIAIGIYASILVERRRRRENQELWDWWDGRQV